MRRRVGPRANLDATGKKKSFTPAVNLIGVPPMYRLQSSQSGHYADWAIPA